MADIVCRCGDGLIEGATCATCNMLDRQEAREDGLREGGEEIERLRARVTKLEAALGGSTLWLADKLYAECHSSIDVPVNANCMRLANFCMDAIRARAGLDGEEG